MGAKGLQASHVYIVGVNESHFPAENNAPNEAEVCQLLVALTRARKLTLMQRVQQVFEGTPDR